jgi:hypothetical protein
MKRRFKIVGLLKDTELAALPFGRQIEHLRKLENFKLDAKSVWISQKRRTSASAIREAIKLYDAKEFYCQFADSATCRDVSILFYYR